MKGFLVGLIENWVRTPLWWKGFYVAFPLSFAFMYTTTLDATFAVRWGFVWALSITFALWASEALKARLRARREGLDGGVPASRRDPSLPHGVDPSDLRRRR
jgi:hypothetical protein